MNSPSFWTNFAHEIQPQKWDYAAAAGGIYFAGVAKLGGLVVRANEVNIMEAIKDPYTLLTLGINTSVTGTGTGSALNSYKDQENSLTAAGRDLLATE